MADQQQGVGKRYLEMSLQEGGDWGGCWLGSNYSCRDHQTFTFQKERSCRDVFGLTILVILTIKKKHECKCNNIQYASFFFIRGGRTIQVSK